MHLVSAGATKTERTFTEFIFILVTDMISHSIGIVMEVLNAETHNSR